MAYHISGVCLLRWQIFLPSPGPQVWTVCGRFPAAVGRVDQKGPKSGETRTFQATIEKNRACFPLGIALALRPVLRTAPAVVLRPARDPCCGPCYCHHTRLSWQLALSPGGFHLRAYLGKRRSRRREPGCPSLGTAAYQGKALGSRSTIRQRSRCCLSCLQAIYVTHPGPGPKPGGRRCIPYRGVDSTRRGKAPPLVGLW